MNQFEHPTQEALIRWVSGDLSDEQAGDFEAHVMSCELCSTRLQDEAALDVILHAASDLALEDARQPDVDVVELPPAPVTVPAAANGGWRQVLAMAAGFALLLVAGRGVLDGPSVDRVEGDAAVADAPASWGDDDEDSDIDPVCDEAPVDDGDMCSEEELVAFAMSTDPAPWSVMGDSLGSLDEDPCTPVDTGESLTCDDWLSADDLAG